MGGGARHVAVANTGIGSRARPPPVVSVPRGPRAAFNHKQARGRGKRWSSKGTKDTNEKLSSSKHGRKQMNSGDKRVWWFIVLARGVVRLKVMPPDWAQTGVGVAEFVDGLPRLLADMLGAASPKPRICFTDRGPGLYNSLTGEIVEAYHAALARNGFRAFAGADGSQQPADLAEFFLHETVVAWVRKWFSKHPFKAVEHVDENLRLFLQRLHECERHINDAYDVHGLCHDTVKRLHTLRDLGGARMKT